MSESNQKDKMGKEPKQEESLGSDSDGPVDDSEITPAREIDEITEGVAGLKLPENFKRSKGPCSREEVYVIVHRMLPPNLGLQEEDYKKLMKQMMDLYTQKLAEYVFTKEELATSSPTQNSKFRQLDEDKVKSLIDAVKQEYPGTTDKEVKDAIQRKCNNTRSNAKTAAESDAEKKKTG